MIISASDHFVNYSCQLVCCKSLPWN